MIKNTKYKVGDIIEHSGGKFKIFNYEEHEGVIRYLLYPIDKDRGAIVFATDEVLDEMKS